MRWVLVVLNNLTSTYLYLTQRRLFFPKLHVHIKNNNKSPHGTFHWFLFPFCGKFPDLNFSILLKPVHDRNTEPGLPVFSLTGPCHVKIFSFFLFKLLEGPEKVYKRFSQLTVLSVNRCCLTKRMKNTLNLNTVGSGKHWWDPPIT